MEDFLKFIKKAQVQELKELETELKSKLSARKKELQNDLNNLEKKLTSDKQRVQKTNKDKQRFDEMKSHDFFVLSTKLEISKNMFFNLVNNKLKDKKYLDKWIEKGKHKIIKLKGETNNKVGQPGFIFENDSIKFEYTRDNYFGEIFEQNKARLLRVLFKK